MISRALLDSRGFMLDYIEKNPQDLIGIELEMESAIEIREIIQMKRPRTVSFVEEGSLRCDGVELISEVDREPLKLCDLPDYFKELERIIQATLHKRYLGERLLTCSERTSTHVHLNITDISIKTRKRLFLNLLTIESLLFEIYGQGREDNVFCKKLVLPLSKIEKERYRSLLTSSSERILLNPKLLKYTSISPVNLLTKGTIEIRLAHLILDTDLLIKYISLLLEVKALSVKEICLYEESWSIDKVVKMFSNSDQLIKVDAVTQLQEGSAIAQGFIEEVFDQEDIEKKYTKCTRQESIVKKFKANRGASPASASGETTIPIPVPAHEINWAEILNTVRPSTDEPIDEPIFDDVADIDRGEY